MAIACRWGLTAAATFSPTLILIDPRIREPMNSSQFTVQDKALAAISFCDHNSIVTAARDKKVTLFDLRMLAVSGVSVLPPGSGKPRCMAVRDHITYVGDSKGTVHLFDLGTSGSVDYFQPVPVAAKSCQIASVCPEVGGFIAGCTDKTVRVVIPTKPLYELKVLHMDYEVTSMSYHNNILAVGKVNGAVDIFKP
ncbi:F-box and wd40 domain protein [Nesidiocoris tenuis]|uniref:F-box and wd40 domain protein n=1 Tax=Nesidiocoris tenuis TaxID=355587 RepID=A0ABN7B4F4_9HEMI|nr:F-box and wd40 domain protein [Nesidiocoris tenuis]